MPFFLRRLLNWLGCKDKVRTRPAPRCRRPILEPLEDRTAPAVIGSQISPSSVSGFVYCDLNHDFRRDPGDPGIAGTPISLFRGTQLIATTFTGLDGSYRFSGLGPGIYTVVEGAVPPSPTMIYVGAYDTVGSIRGASRSAWGRSIQPDILFSIHLGLAQTGINYNFAVLCAPVPAPTPPVLPGITILKYISQAGGDNNFGQTHVTSPGQAFTDNIWSDDTVTYTYYVTNTGQLPLTNIVLNDDNGSTVGTFSSSPPSPFSPTLVSPVGGTVLMPGQTWIFTSGVLSIPFNATGPIYGGQVYVENIATVSALASNGATVTASDQSFYFIHFSEG
jgi:hypothetical protein